MLDHNSYFQFWSHYIDHRGPLFWSFWPEVALTSRAWRWCTFRFAGRSQTLVSILKWHVYWINSDHTTCIAPCIHNVVRACRWRTAIDPASRHISINDRRKLTEQEGGTSKFAKVALNCAISSPFDRPPEMIRAFTRFYPRCAVNSGWIMWICAVVFGVFFLFVLFCFFFSWKQQVGPS